MPSKNGRYLPRDDLSSMRGDHIGPMHPAGVRAVFPRVDRHRSMANATHRTAFNRLGVLLSSRHAQRRIKSVSAAPGPWALAKCPTKDPPELRLIAKPACDRNLGHRFAGRFEQFHGVLDPSLPDVFERWNSDADLESSEELTRADAPVH